MIINNGVINLVTTPARTLHIPDTDFLCQFLTNCKNDKKTQLHVTFSLLRTETSCGEGGFQLRGFTRVLTRSRLSGNTCQLSLKQTLYLYETRICIFKNLFLVSVLSVFVHVSNAFCNNEKRITKMVQNFIPEFLLLKSAVLFKRKGSTFASLFQKYNPKAKKRVDASIFHSMLLVQSCAGLHFYSFLALCKGEFPLQLKSRANWSLECQLFFFFFSTTNVLHKNVK